MADWMWKTRLRSDRRWAAGAIAALTAAILIASASTSSADPPHALAATDLVGCCVCRGTEGASASTVRSCSDGVSVNACVSQCKGQNADSIAYGYKQTCSQGCAGFPTQNLH